MLGQGENFHMHEVGDTISQLQKLVWETFRE